MALSAFACGCRCTLPVDKDDGHGALGLGGPCWEHTAVAHCQRVSDEDPGAVGAGGPGLQHTAVTHCQLVSD